ncbi:MAG: Bro-N domain-containing protein [Bacteroidetes bacterium]|nr:Bro-N domain-containing protein [Bacteroidota bacterium]
MSIKIFEQKKVRSAWDEHQEKWYFSVIDIVEVLTDSPRPRKYWNALKTKLKAEGSELSQDLGQLKLQSEDGKFYKTDVADTEQILRLIQSIPSKKAEPFKLWLAKVGSERIDETIDPELSIDRAIQNYRRLGYSENWINQRIKSIEVRKALTDEWDKSGVKQGKEYADLTDLMSKTWSGMNTREYKNFKGLKKENLRDNMTNTELVLNMLAEVAATDISVERQPVNFAESAQIATEGAMAAQVARKQIEKSTGKPAISSLNAKSGMLIGKK